MIIAISGKKGSGKSTLADCLGDYEYRKEFMGRPGDDRVIRRLKFADPIYGVAWTLFPDCKNKSDMTDLGMTMGRFLQDFGTEYIRSKNPDFWIHHMKRRIRFLSDELCPFEPVIIIDDLRFKNEAEMLRGLGAVLVRLERRAELTDKRNDQHQSEIDLDDWKDWDIIVPDSCGDARTTALYVARSLDVVLAGRPAVRGC